MRKQTGSLLIVVALCLLSACGEDPSAGGSAPEPLSQPDDATKDDSVPRLVTWPESDNDSRMEALVSGRLELNDRACFTLDGTVLAAPPESTATATSITIPGLGEYQLGQEVQGTGGTLSDATAFEYAADCVAAGDSLIVISAE